LAAVGFAAGSWTGLLGFGLAAGGFSASDSGASFASSAEGVVVEGSEEFAALLAPLASAGAGAFSDGAPLAGGLADGVTAAGAPDDAGEAVPGAGCPAMSGVGCAAVCPVPATGGVLGVLEAGGVVELASGVSEFCAAADGLFVCEPNHPNP